MKLSIPVVFIFCLLFFELTLTSKAQPLEKPYESVNETVSPNTFYASQSSAVISDTFYYEDFADNAPGWTFDNIIPESRSVWKWSNDDSLSRDSGDTRWFNFESPTAFNGFMWYDYRFYVAEYHPGIRNVPLVLIGDVVSPYLDWSSFDPSIEYALNFFSYQPTLNVHASTVAIRRPGVSDVVIWNAFQDVLRPNEAPQATQIASLPQGIIGNDSIQIVIHYEGDFYGWALDDILLTKLPEIEVQTNDFIAIAPNLETPSGQSTGRSMAFLADVQNNGSETIDMALAITIFDGAGAMIYADTTRYADVATDELRENQAFNNSFPMPSEDGTYLGVYEIFTERIDEDVIQANNTQTFEFTVGGDVFSKGDFASGARPAGDDVEYGFTNLYYTPGLARINPEDTFYIKSVTFGMFPQNFTDGDEAFVDLKTYGFRGDLNGDNIAQYGDIDDAEAEMVELAAREFIIDTSFTQIPYAAAVTYTPDADGTVRLPSDANFVGFGVMVNYIPGTGGTNGDNVCFLGNTENWYAAFDIAASQVGVADSLSTILTTDQVGNFGFYNDSSPFIQAEINVSPFVSSVQKTVLAESAFDVRPNPATTEFSINFDFKTPVDAQFEIMNAVGQLVSSFNRAGLTTGAITIPTQGMNNGLYYVKVRTDDGQTATRKLLLAR